MEISVWIIVAMMVAGAVVGWLTCNALAQRRFDARQLEFRERLEAAQRELDERVLRAKQAEAQQLGLEKDADTYRRRIAELELEIGRLRMKIVDLETRSAPAAQSRQA